jgi:hypothetical protein
MYLSEYERRQSEPQFWLLPSPSADPRVDEISGTIESVNFQERRRRRLPAAQNGREPRKSLKLLWDQFG